MHLKVDVPDQEISVIKFLMIVMVLGNMTPCTLYIGSKVQEDNIPSIFRVDYFVFSVNGFTLKMEAVGRSEMLQRTSQTIHHYMAKSCLWSKFIAARTSYFIRY
jgi:hypothetical protein